jgi:hypothetical protein
VIDAADSASEPIIGWRSWYVSDEAKPRLKSLAASTSWEHGFPIVATNVDEFGIHAFLSESDAMDYIEPGAANRDRFLLRRAYGSVYLWGKVIRCEYGYRAQYAYPKNLKVERVDHPGQPERDFPSVLRALYGCEAQWNDDHRI